MSLFKPMLAGTCKEITKLNYPVLISPKLDGIRATIQDGTVLTRTLKDIPNLHVRRKFSTLPWGTDGELIAGNPTDKDVYLNSVSAVMREDGEPNIKFYAFDICNKLPFEKRYKQIEQDLKSDPDVIVVKHTLVASPDQLTTLEEFYLDLGYEGLMIRSIDGPYKHGRSTGREGYLLKLKRFCDAEAVITGFYEEMENQNEAKKNALGRTERSTQKDGMVGKGTLGGFEVIGYQGDYDGIIFSIGGGFTADDRIQMWKMRKDLIGRIVKYSYFPTGSKERPRFPVFLGFRDKSDMNSEKLEVTGKHRARIEE